MAKVFGPFVGIAARGKFGKAAVFAMWKGMTVAKGLKSPANPSSEDQQTERASYGACVGFYRTYPLTTFDKDAFRRYMKLLNAAGTEYNEYVRRCVLCQNAAAVWRRCHDAFVTYDDATKATFGVHMPTNQVTYLWVGTRPTGMVSRGTMFWNAGEGFKYLQCTDMEEGTEYFFTFKGAGFQQAGVYRYVHQA
jgi:hypothetical protein